MSPSARRALIRAWEIIRDVETSEVMRDFARQQIESLLRLCFQAEAKRPERREEMH